MGKIIAVVNEKGGVAKTSTVKHLSAGLGLRGYTSLLIDIDPSATLSASFGKLPDKEEVGAICYIMHSSMNCDDIDLDDCGIISLEEENVDLITSSSELRELEDGMMKAFQRELVLGRFCELIKDRYDFVFIDCPAGHGIYTQNALFCADELIIPMEPSVLDVEATQNTLEQVAKVRKYRGDKPYICGLLFTKTRVNINNDKDIMNDIYSGRKMNNIRAFESFIPNLSKIKESDVMHQSIFKYAPNSAGAWNFGNLVDEFLEIQKLSLVKEDEEVRKDGEE